MTRKEAEEKILKALKEVRETYLAYNPNGDWLNINIYKDYIRAENSFGYGQKDYDYPIYISVDSKKEKK